MDWKSALMTFAVVFAMELGDKTQLTVLAIASRSKSPHMIFLGAALALAASSLLAVWAGGTLLRSVPDRVIRLGTGTAFTAIGLMLLIKSFR